MADANRTPVETTEHGVLYSDNTVLIKMVRASYPFVLKKSESTNDEGVVTSSYQITGLMPKETHEDAYKLLRKAITKLLKEENKGVGVPANKRFLRDGDPADEDDPGKPENRGMWVVACREGGKRPQVLSNRKDPKTGKARRLDPNVQEDVDMIYGGCWVNILVRPWFQNNKYGKRVNAGVVAVQFRKDDEPFGSGRISDDEIDEAFVPDEEVDEPGDFDDL